MSRKLRGLSGVVGLLSISGALAILADDSLQTPVVGAAPADHDAWMRLKLVSSQEVFAGLTHGEFQKVETAARRMLALNALEQWLERKPLRERSAYRGQLNAFEYSVKELVRTAEAHDQDGALEAYVSMSRSCVRCHALIRDPSPAAP